MKRERLIERSGATPRDNPTRMQSHRAPINLRWVKVAGLLHSPMTSRVMKRVRVWLTSVVTLKDSLIMPRPSLPRTPLSSIRSHPVLILNRSEVKMPKLEPLMLEKSTKKHRRSSRRVLDASADERRRTRTRVRTKVATTSLVKRSENKQQRAAPRMTTTSTKYSKMHWVKVSKARRKRLLWISPWRW